MPIPVVVEDLSNVREALRPHYNEEGGVFVLQVEGLDAHPAVVELKESFEAAKLERRRLKEGYAKIEETYRAAVKAAREARSQARAALVAVEPDGPDPSPADPSPADE